MPVVDLNICNIDIFNKFALEFKVYKNASIKPSTVSFTTST
jgi:hypothetical protein